MAETSDQSRPLAGASDRPTSSDDEESALTGIRRKRCVKCFTCVAALLLIQAIVIVVLIFTVFKVKDPIIRMNRVTVTKLDLVAGTTTPRPGANMTLIADVSVKNPNYASFRYQNTTTALYYHGSVIGEARGPPGRARARRTMRMNITVDVMTDRVLANSDFASDLTSGLLTMSSYTEVAGRVKMVVVKKHVTVKMNCTVTVNMTTQAIQEQRCKRKVKL
ncbi:late embryogenesis abundant protein At1g64065 [Andrographis paniculata]|uniref:late embryogenesis abundant protein At1g64065 n=1 Tax=Andrographis paniculata TaxID=175694 RepID=UPI0021E8CEE6|nr:late embryogenesis abundant protein At1g64065 [Andrographis paniculata]